MHTSFQIGDFVFFRWISKSRIAGSYGSSVFSFLRTRRIVYHSGCTNLHSHQVIQEGSLFSTSSSTFVICCVLRVAVLTSVRWYLIVVFISVSLIVHNVEHLVPCPLATGVPSLEKYRCLCPLPIFSPFFGFTHTTWKFLRQGSNPSSSCSLQHSCGHARPLTRGATVGNPLSIF